MYKIGFDNDKYLSMQSGRIKERIDEFGGKLYLEFGGKLFDDYHASRVLPGFHPDSKLQMLLQLKDEAEVVIVISAQDIEKRKVRGDLGITYDNEVIRLIKEFTGVGLMVGSVVITKYAPGAKVEAFEERLKKAGYPVYRHYLIEGYPSNIANIVSDNGYGKMIISKQHASLLSSPHPVRAAEKWQPAFHSFITRINAESKPAMQSLKHSRFGICRLNTPSMLPMRRQPQI